MITKQQLIDYQGNLPKREKQELTNYFQTIDLKTAMSIKATIDMGSAAYQLKIKYPDRVNFTAIDLIDESFKMQEDYFPYDVHKSMCVTGGNNCCHLEVISKSENEYSFNNQYQEIFEEFLNYSFSQKHRDSIDEVYSKYRYFVNKISEIKKCSLHF